MKIVTKILLSIAILCGGSLISGAIVTAMGNKASTGGIGPFIIFPAIIAGIWAVWKYKPENNDNDDNHKLDKS